jgi:ParB-like chromosome segregation protein Spo0J
MLCLRCTLARNFRAVGPCRAGRAMSLRLKEKYQVLPSMPSEQFEALKADIEERGVLTPIDVDEHGYILDGHHRYRACLELGVTDFPTIVRPGMSEEERRMFARKSNMLRRHLSREQVRQLVAEQLKDTPNWANNRIASSLGVDGKTVRTLRDELEATSEIPKFERLIGADGKERPVRQKRAPAVMASNLSELERILKRIESADPAEIEGFCTETGLVFMGTSQSEIDRLSAPEQRQWEIFGDFLVHTFGWSIEAASHHMEWVIRHDYRTPEDWLGDEGNSWRKKIGMRNPSTQFLEKWNRYSAEHHLGEAAA